MDVNITQHFGANDGMGRSGVFAKLWSGGMQGVTPWAGNPGKDQSFDVNMAEPFWQ